LGIVELSNHLRFNYLCIVLQIRSYEWHKLLNLLTSN